MNFTSHFVLNTEYYEPKGSVCEIVNKIIVMKKYYDDNKTNNNNKVYKTNNCNYNTVTDDVGRNRCSDKYFGLQGTISDKSQ